MVRPDPRRWLPILLLLSGCPYRPPPPAPDKCNSPSGGLVATLEIGAGTFDGSFSPLRDDGELSFINGPQGSPMVTLRIRVSGIAPPACLAQTTTVRTEDDVETNSSPLNTYAQPDGSRMTHTVYVIMNAIHYDKSPVYVTTEAAGLTVTRHLFVVGGADFAVPGDAAPPMDPMD